MPCTDKAVASPPCIRLELIGYAGEAQEREWFVWGDRDPLSIADHEYQPIKVYRKAEFRHYADCLRKIGYPPRPVAIGVGKAQRKDIAR